MKNLNVLIKPASSLCNLRCRYCFYHDVAANRDVPSTGVMNEEDSDLLIRRIAEYLEEEGTANIAFQGGEPTVAGVEWFTHFTKKMEEYPKVKVNYFLQTNATLLNEEWVSLFKKYHFLIGVSIDGYQTNMDHFRYDVSKRGVYYKVLSGIDMLKKAGVDFNILTVVTADLAKHPKALLNWVLEHRFEYLQLIPCLPGLEEKDSDIALSPRLYASFYKEFFKEWKSALLKGKFVNVNLFEHLTGILEGYPPYQCGMIGKCVIQYVIEGNGDVYPCDFYCLDEYCLGNLKDLSLKEMAESDRGRKFLEGSECRKAPCTSCPYLYICNGGCRRQNVCYLEEGYCAYKEVLDEILPQLDQLRRR